MDQYKEEKVASLEQYEYDNLQEYYSSQQEKHKHRDVNYVAPGNFGLLSDEDLLLLPTKELNLLVKNSSLTKEEGNRLKLKRRTLKNRGYAATCRNKKDGRNQELDEELNMLDLNSQILTSKLDRNLERTAFLERQNELLADMLNNKDKYEMVKEEGVYKVRLRLKQEIKQEADDDS